MNNWDDLRVFLAVARAGNLTLAGQGLGLSQPSVGRRLAVLEDRLGGPLFLRSGRQWPLTDLGRDLIEQASRMQEAADAITMKAAGHTSGPKGLVRLTSTDGLGAYWLPPLLPQLQDSHPDIILEVLTGNRPLDLTRHGADIALRLYRPDEPDLVARCLGEIAFGLFAAPTYINRHGLPETLVALASHRFIGQAQEYDTVREFTWLRRHVPEPDFRFQSGSALAQANAAAQGMGLALLPLYLARRFPPLQEITLEERPDGKELWIATHRDLRQVPKVAAVWDFLKAMVRSDPLLVDQVRD